MKSFSANILALIVLSFFSNLEAKSYVFGGLGAQFNVGSLGDIITKEGLDASNYYSVKSTDGQDGVAPRLALIPENRLISLENSTVGLISAKTNGSMTGLVISLGYEREFSNVFFWRVTANYTRKVMGGDTQAKLAGVTFYDMEWDYNAIQIPVNVGMKVSVSEDVAIYLGGGAHYFKGGWSLSGSNISADVHRALSDAFGPDNPWGGLVNDGADPSVLWENTRFNVSGLAPNWLIGAQAKLSDKNYLYIEAETLFSSEFGIGHTRSLGGADGLAPSPVYPIVLGGTQYRVGYKHEM